MVVGERPWRRQGPTIQEDGTPRQANALTPEFIAPAAGTKIYPPLAGEPDHGGPAFQTATMRAADANDDGFLNMADPISTLHFHFLGGPDLPPPSGEVGEYPTPDAMRGLDSGAAWQSGCHSPQFSARIPGFSRDSLTCEPLTSDGRTRGGSWAELLHPGCQVPASTGCRIGHASGVRNGS